MPCHLVLLRYAQHLHIADRPVARLFAIPGGQYPLKFYYIFSRLATVSLLVGAFRRKADYNYEAQRIGQIPAHMGKFFVFGNHDLGSHGPALQYTENELRQALADANIRLLDDESVVTDDFILIGRRDIWMAQRWAGRKSVAQLLPEDTQNKPILVLDHQPHNAKEAAQAGADLQLSGHTHAGQIWPASWLGRLSPTFYGLHWFGNMALVVSSGLGGRGSRLRSGCSAEYVILDLNGS